MSINAYQEELVEKKKFLKYVRRKIPDIKLTIMTSSVILLRGCKNSWLKIWSTPKSSAQSKEFRDAGKDTSPNGIGGTKFSVKSTPLE